MFKELLNKGRNMLSLKRREDSDNNEMEEQYVAPTFSNNRTSYIDIEKFDMSGYEIDPRILKKIFPLHDMWTFTHDVNGVWMNNLYKSKDVAIQFGMAYCRENNLESFYLGRTSQLIDLGVNAQQILTILKINVLSLVDFNADYKYMDKLTDKAVYGLQNSLIEVLSEWLNEQHLNVNTFTIVADSVEIYNAKGKKIPLE